MKLQHFNGGLSTRKRPQYIQAQEAPVYVNINSDVGSLTPILDKTITDIVVQRYHTFYDTAQQWVSSNILTYYNEFQKILYATDTINRPTKFNGVTTSNLGITPPPKLTSFTTNLSPEFLESITLTTSASGSLPARATFYLFYNKDSGVFSSGLAGSLAATGRLGTFTSGFRGSPSQGARANRGSTATWDVTISEAEGITIGAQGIEVYRLYKDDYYLVGTLVSDVDTLVDNILDISGNTPLDLNLLDPIDGVIQYIMAYVNSSDGTESGTSEVSDEIDLIQGGTIQLNDIPKSTDPQVDKKRLYRIGGNITLFTLVTELDNNTTVYLDTLKDTEVEGSLATTIGDLPAPIGLAFLVDAYAMLFGAIGPKLLFTPIGKPNNWPTLNFLLYEADITGIAPVTNGILVFTKFKTHLVTGTGPTTLSSQLLTSNQGCLAFESIQVIEGTALWVSTDGICSSSGASVFVLSKDKLGKILLAPIDSVIHDETYYCLNSDKSILAYEFGVDRIFKNFELDILTIAVANDTLYGWLNGVQHTLFTGDNSSFKYLSPRFVEGRVTELKTYKKLYLYSKGVIIIKILINDEVVSEHEFIEEGIHIMQPPQQVQRGSFVQFDITGSGEVYELEWVVGSRQND